MSAAARRPAEPPALRAVPLHRAARGRLLRALSCGLAALAVAAACGSDDGGDDGNGGGAADGAAYLTFAEAYDRASCERSLRCDAMPRGATVEACLADRDAGLQRSKPRIAASIDAGHTVFHPADAQRCLDAQALACDAGAVAVLGPCNAARDGLVELGGACVGHFECADPPDARADEFGPFCFEGCTGLFGTEDVSGRGTCVRQSPIGSAACP